MRKIYKFKIPYQKRVEITNLLAEKHPNVYVNEAISTLKRNLLHKAFLAKTALPDKIHSTYVKNGILRINPKGNSTDPAQPVKIRNEVELREFFKSINFVSQSTGTDTNQTPENESR